MTVLVACPVILPPRPGLLESWNAQRMLIVVNGAHQPWRNTSDTIDAQHIEYRWNDTNFGVAWSWNHAFGIAQRDGHDHVAIVSQGLILEGGTRRLVELVASNGDERGLLTDFAFHAIVLSVATYEAVGPFDEGFFPAYFEDSDYLRRMFLAGIHTPDRPMRKVGRDLLDGDEWTAGALKEGVVPEASYAESHERYVAKWGGEPFHERYVYPFADDSEDPTCCWAAEEAARHHR